MFDDDDDYVPADQCAARLGLTVPEVMELVERRVLKARRYAGWRLEVVEVQPAIVVGHTDTPKPKQRKRSAKK